MPSLFQHPTPCPRDVAIGGTVTTNTVYCSVAASKADPHRLGVTIAVCRTSDSVCQIQTLLLHSAGPLLQLDWEVSCTEQGSWQKCTNYQQQASAWMCIWAKASRVGQLPQQHTNGVSLLKAIVKDLPPTSILTALLKQATRKVIQAHQPPTGTATRHSCSPAQRQSDCKAGNRVQLGFPTGQLSFTLRVGTYSGISTSSVQADPAVVLGGNNCILELTPWTVWYQQDCIMMSSMS